jgi:hypothetical protein
MNRRDAIGRVALIMGGAVIGAEFFLSGCKPTSTQVSDLFDTDHIAFMNEVADTILPTTAASPGAKAANVGQFMAVMVRDCYTPGDQKIFLDGLKKLDDASQKQAGSKFLDLSSKQRADLLIALDKEQKDYYTQQYKKLDADMAKHKGDENYEPADIPDHYYRMIKELTLLGYFTSEVGSTKALRYMETPGRYDGCMPYKKGDKAWAIDD